MPKGMWTSHEAAEAVLVYPCIRPGVCQSRSGAVGCLFGFVSSLSLLVLVAPCDPLHVSHFRPDLLEESRPTENLTNKPQRTSDLIRKYVSLLVNVGTARLALMENIFVIKSHPQKPIRNRCEC